MRSDPCSVDTAGHVQPHGACLAGGALAPSRSADPSCSALSQTAHAGSLVRQVVLLEELALCAYVGGRHGNLQCQYRPLPQDVGSIRYGIVDATGMSEWIAV